MATGQQQSIAVSPLAQGGASQHLRRPPAHRLVSLAHSSNSRSGSSDGSRPPQKSTDSPSSLRPQGRGSSGESSNAEDWFEHSNNDVQTTSASYMDHEPPFFMRNSSSSETPPNRQEQLRRYFEHQSSANSLPRRAGLLDLGTDGGSTDDYRSVIDDLTIKNKKLKRRLKKYEQLHDAHMKEDKLFEVRIHGLPADKKRQLEETLRKFASSLGTNSDAQFPANGYEGVVPMLIKQQTTDSAYASMSASGQGGSSGQSGNNSRHNDATPSLASKRRNVQSFLHQMPEVLLPQPNPASMTEREKKKMVVRRLEQIFAGKGAGAVGLQHTQQQEELSQVAARANRSAMEAQGQPTRQEGFREATIMRGDPEDTKQASPHAQIAEQDFAARSPVQSAMDQRPTRPLDLDPHRAQVPADNVRYIRHLGFSPIDPESSKSPEGGHGWIYLNLLASMAQLHTMNVTTDFVCTALNDHSEKFELSQDGRKVRWKGGRGVSRANSDDKASAPTHEHVRDGRSARKRPKLSHRGGSNSNVKGNGGTTQRSHAASNKYAYTPMFFCKDSTDEANESLSEGGEDTISTPLPPSTDANRVSKTESALRGSLARSKRHNDGPIIFYNNAKFCTDLSGEREPQGNLNAPPYTKLATQPVGKQEVRLQGVCERRGPLAEAYDLPEPMDLGDNPIPESMEIAVPIHSPPASKLAVAKPPINFEVAGIGGVWPADNFAIDVHTRHALIDRDAAPKQSNISIPVLQPPRFARILNSTRTKRKSGTAVHEQVVTSKLRELLPSALPPALSYMYTGDSADEDEDDTDDDEETAVSPASAGVLPPYTAPQPLGVNFADSDDDEDDEEDDDSDVESDTSLDLLAVARELDPEAIRAREREYDLNMAERLAEEIPAGSSAATAGGGSAFGSPGKSVTREGYRCAVHDARAARPAGLKRARTSDSLYVQGQASSSGSDDGLLDDEMSDICS